VEAVQPSTLLAGGAIFVLLYNALAAALPRRAPGPWPPPAAAERAREARLQAAVARRVRAAGDAAARLVATATALVARRLSGLPLCLQRLRASAWAPACPNGAHLRQVCHSRPALRRTACPDSSWIASLAVLDLAASFP